MQSQTAFRAAPICPWQGGVRPESCDLRCDRASSCWHAGVASRRSERAIQAGMHALQIIHACPSPLLPLSFPAFACIDSDCRQTGSLSRLRSARFRDKNGFYVSVTALPTSLAAAPVSLWPWRHCCKSSVTLPCSRQRACLVVRSCPTQCLLSPGR